MMNMNGAQGKRMQLSQLHTQPQQDLRVHSTAVGETKSPFKAKFPDKGEKFIEHRSYCFKEIKNLLGHIDLTQGIGRLGHGQAFFRGGPQVV